MSFQKKHQDLPRIITERDVMDMVSKSLRFEHQDDTSRIKTISGKIAINPNTVAKWYQRSNAPSSTHLLVLASVYPQILRGLLEMIGRGDVWGYCLANNIPQRMYYALGGEREHASIYGDKFVHLDVVLHHEIATKLNQRQLWFAGEVQRGEKIGAAEISIVWKNSLRTSRRDIDDLVRFEVLQYHGARKTGYYSSVLT
ncbi:MAG: hypothetical protein COA43_05955 [Robiginitomaculum sp.]|nr:MAG: hypothetical protein COA43_05955 [Robiginitomaculum sp.]